jgi:uncharacterized protein (TIGR03067 family)
MVATNLVEVPSIATVPARTSTFKVVAGEPMGLDLTTVHHHDQSLLFTKAIYRFAGDALIYCVGAPGQPRPTEFTTRSGDGRTLVVLRRGSIK